MRQYDTMADDAQNMIRGQSWEPAGYLWLGLAHLLLGDAEQSLDQFDRAAELSGRRDIRLVWAKALRGLALLGMDRPDDALVELNETLLMAPDLPVGLLARAKVSSTLGNMRGAVADLSGVITQEPDNAHAIALRGEHFEKLGDFDEAVRDFSEAMRIAGPTPALQFRVISAAFRQRNMVQPKPADAMPTEDPAVPSDVDQSSSRRFRRWLGWPDESDGAARTRGAATHMASVELAFVPLARR
jgi:tetratricopeptide (TPR) repeat protein